MKYEAPELTPLTLAIDAIQSLKDNSTVPDSAFTNDAIGSYADWE